MKYPGFIGGSFEPQATTADNSRTVNWYVEPSQGEAATAQASLLPVPGFELIEYSPAATYGAGGFLPRAHTFINGREFAVMDDRLWEINVLGAVTDRGNVGDDRLPATITANGDVGSQLWITSNRNGFVFNLTTNVLTQVAAMDGRCFQGDYLDGYFLTLDDRSSTLYISALADGASWTPGVDFAQRLLRPDRWIAMKVCGRFIWLFGRETSEVWYNTAASFPFAPHPSGLLNFGIRGQWTAGLIGSDIMWLARTETGRLSVVRGSGFTPQIVSPYSLDLALDGYAFIESAYADVYSEAGHTFYVLTLKDDDVTWALDTTTGVWCERASWDLAEDKYVAWYATAYAHAYNQHRWFSRATGLMYRLSIDSVTDLSPSGVYRRLRRCPAPFNDDKRVFYSSMELDLEAGLGHSVTPHGPAPSIMLRLSNDGGKTWPVERWESAGKLGEYQTRAKWSRLGSARRRVFEVVVTDPAIWRLTGAYLEAETGSA